MAKKTQKRHVRQERDQSGCMPGLLSMFDFRHGQTTQKLISDKRQVAAAGKSIIKPDILINTDKNRPVASKDPEFEEKLSEAIKLFISQRLYENHETGEAEILSLDEDQTLKLLQVQNSATDQYFENLWNSQVEKVGISKLLVGSDLSKQVTNEPEKVAHSKERKFFRRKAGSLDTASQGSKTIVVLKPSARVSDRPDAEGTHGPVPEAQADISNKRPNERVGSHFFLTEIKRRLKQAIGKEQQEVSKRSFKAKGDDEKIYEENGGRNSPTKDHFFIEKTAKGRRISKDHGIPRQKLSNMYVEAKKHLSEMFTSGTGDSDLSNRQVPKSLGRILSLPEYDFSPVGSPVRDWGQSFVTAQTKFSAADKFQKQEPNLDLELCPSDADSPKKAEALSNRSTRFSHEIEINSSSIGDRTCFGGDVDVKETTEILVRVKINDARHYQNTHILNVTDAKGFNESSKHVTDLQDLDEEHRSPPSILTSSPSASVNKKVYSPVSVLEPLFIHEDISPASVGPHPADSPIQTLTIKFEEAGTRLKGCIEFEDSIFEYVKAVLEASELNWDEFYTMSSSSDPLLDLSTFDEVEFLPSELCSDKKLLFDCINEDLMELYERYFGFPLGLSFSKSTTRAKPDLKGAIYEVWKGVCRHLLPLPVPHRLEQIVNKDMAKSGIWMDLQCDCEEMIVEIGESIFSDLMEETVLSYINERSE